MDLGTMVEGIVELDPLSERMVLRIQKLDGTFTFLDVQEVLTKYTGEEVRFIMTPIRTIETLAKMVESGEKTLEEATLIRVPKTTH